MPQWSRLLTLVSIITGVSCSMALADIPFLLEKGHHSYDSSSSHYRHHRGRRGPRGHRGKRGYTGPTGPMGAVGQTGQQGQVGPQGPEGQQGPEGPAGTGYQAVYADFYGELDSHGDQEVLENHSINFPHEQIQSGGFLWASTDTDDIDGIFIPEDGVYSVEAIFSTDPTSGDLPPATYVELRKNGTVSIDHTSLFQVSDDLVVIKAIVPLNEEDIISVVNKSGTLNLQLPGGENINYRHMILTKLGPIATPTPTPTTTP